MNWIIAAGIVILLALIAYYALALGIDLLLLAVYALVGIVKLVTAPFRHRHR